MVEKKYCIICGNATGNSKFFCSSGCADVSLKFRLDETITAIQGFCNNCSKPLMIIKDSNGRYQPVHSDCSSVETDIISGENDVHDGLEDDGSVEFKDTYSEVRPTISESNSIFEEGSVPSLSADPEMIKVRAHDDPLTFKRKSYYYNLKTAVDDFGEYEDVLRYLPDFYLLICNIVQGERSSWYTKMLANAALSYLVLENDLIADEMGAEGYLDDLFLCAYVLKEIRDKVSKNIILESLGELEYGDEIFQLIYDVVNITSHYLDIDTDKILKFVGLDKFTQLDLLYDEEVSKKIENRKEKKKVFYAMIAVKAKEILESNDDSPETFALKNMVKDHYEFAEISTYMRFLDDGQ
jgi:uncharacterized membrane protein YkvA (DUF1232 family)/predicted nucleic acid-binding Zn ribbon protein